VPSLIEERRAETKQRLAGLEEHLTDAARRLAGKACVYLTGSFARGEASQHSDLDLFIVGRSENVDGTAKRTLSRLDEICVEAELIEMTRKVRVPDFSGDGEYLTHYTIEDLVGALGHPEDDATNTFTARMLLLLESRPLLGADVHEEAVARVLERYWRDFAGREDKFMPGFLANYILRMWRTFCVNYEARTDSEPREKKAKRKLKNYKPKHSRLLTCYSALAYLSAAFRARSTVTLHDAKQMVALSPTARLESIAETGRAETAKLVKEILDCYTQFLGVTNDTEAALISIFMDRAKRESLPPPNRLGNLMAALLSEVGNGSLFHRVLLV
jgi:predicted nucleotidyltransferase